MLSLLKKSLILVYFQNTQCVSLETLDIHGFWKEFI